MGEPLDVFSLLWEVLRTTYLWIVYNVPQPWLAILHSIVSLYVGYLLGQNTLAERVKRDGYTLRIWRDRHGNRRYFPAPNGLKVPDDDDDLDGIG